MEKIRGRLPGGVDFLDKIRERSRNFLDKIRERLRGGCGYLETNIASSFCGGMIPGGELTSKITRREFPGKISRALLLSLGVFAHHLSAAGSDFVVSRQSSVFAHHLSAAGSDFVASRQSSPTTSRRQAQTLVISRQSSPTTSRRQTRTIVVSLRPPPLGGGLRLSSSVVYVVVSLRPAPRGARRRLYVVICPEPLAMEKRVALYSFK